MQTTELVKLLYDTGTWGEFEADWKQQCSAVGEDFEGYASVPLSVVKDIIEKCETKTGAYALKMDGKHMAMCQLNATMLPGYNGMVLRVRFITLCPELDLSETESQYANTLASMLIEVLKLALSDQTMGARHIKFHLRSPADIKFFTMLGKGLKDIETFESVDMRGTWLYMSLK